MAVGHEIPYPSWEWLRGGTEGLGQNQGHNKIGGEEEGKKKIITHRCPVSDRARDEEFFFFSVFFPFFSFFVFN